MTEFKPIKEGKVREIYATADSLVMVCQPIAFPHLTSS